MTEDDIKKIEIIKEGCLHSGIKLLLEDLKQSKSGADTIKVMPILDQSGKTVLSSQTDEMLKRLGFVSGLEMVIGWIEHYQSWDRSMVENDADL